MSYKTISHEQLTWIDIIKPSAADMDRLQEEYPLFHPLAIEDCLSPLERPKIDDYDDHLFIVVQFPLWDSSQRVSRSAEVDIFVGADFFITVHSGELKPLVKCLQEAEELPEAREHWMSRGGSHLMHAVIDQLVDYLFPILSKVDANIRAIEEDIFSENTHKIVKEISIARRDIIALRRIIRHQVMVLAELEKMHKHFVREDLDDYFGDILDHLTKARDIIEENAEIIVGLADTADTLASHRINEVMRILTVISVIMLPLTLIAGIFGMNVPLPFQRSIGSLFGVLGLMLFISIGMLIYFRRRHWL